MYLPGAYSSKLPMFGQRPYRLPTTRSMGGYGSDFMTTSPGYGPPPGYGQQTQLQPTPPIQQPSTPPQFPGYGRPPFSRGTGPSQSPKMTGGSYGIPPSLPPGSRPLPPDYAKFGMIPPSMTKAGWTVRRNPADGQFYMVPPPAPSPPSNAIPY